MDRALKERIIGAIVLVAFAVLVVPVFLDGPSSDAEIVREAVTLPGQSDQPRRQQTIVLERDRTEPVPVASAPPPVLAQASTEAGTMAAATDDESTANEPQVDEPMIDEPMADEPMADEPMADESMADESMADEPVADETMADEPPDDAQPAASSTGMWAVQLGSFSNRENAERLAADLREDGYAAFLSGLDTANGQLHRVRIGPQQDRDAAESVAASLTRSGHSGQVVPHP